MNSKRSARAGGWLRVLTAFGLLAAAPLAAEDRYIYREFNPKEALSLTGRVTLHGELFSQLQAPSSFPSYNDLSGPADRWEIGFQDYVLITPTTEILAQLVAHNRGAEFTKFDWHFALRQRVVSHLVFLIGHDSNHDADHESRLYDKHFFLNRNYLGVGVPFTGRGFLVEPFVRFFHHSNQRTRLDVSGEPLKQESGLRVGARLGPAATLSFQGLIQSSGIFNLAQAWSADVFLELRLTDWLQAVVGGGLWRDWSVDAAGRKQSFRKLIWGISVPF